MVTIIRRNPPATNAAEAQEQDAAKGNGEVEYPADHTPGMAVPKGGSSCALCEYYRGAMKCGNSYFIKWNGTEDIPAKSPDAYCSDWFEPIGPDDYDEEND